MKKIAALILIGLMCLTAAHAAQWSEGCGPAKPYPGVPEVNLDQTMGYVVLSPSEKLPATGCCDRLRLFLPREDLALQSGAITLLDASGELARMDASDVDAVRLRPMTEEELAVLRWGGGTCLEALLPVSLTLGQSCYVNVDAGCFAGAEGKVRKLAVSGAEAWKIDLNGDFGLNGLSYVSAATGESVVRPAKGDSVAFDLVLGGGATRALIYSENDSVVFPTQEYAESGRVTGEIASSEVKWQVLFLNDEGEALQLLTLDR